MLKFDLSDLKYFLIIIAFILTISSSSAQEPGAPRGLLCELLREPAAAVITDKTPEFGWIVNDSRRGAVQTAFQILVASDEALLVQDKADMWDSKKIISSQSINIEYHGRPLLENKSYWWQVRTWDAAGKPSPFSKPQQFRTGNLNDTQRAWPAESKWVRLENGDMVLENRQKASYHEIAPKEFLQTGPGHYFVDFGKAAFATIKVTLKSERAGDSLVVYLGERRQHNTVNKKPGRTNIGFKKAVLPLERGKHEYTVQLPRFISRFPNGQMLPEHTLEVTPFRYAEFVNAPEGLVAGDIRQIALFYYFDDQASSFTCSNDALNRVWDLCKYTLKATPFLALYVDGNRERMPYEADAYIQQQGHYCVDREFSVARYTNQFLIFNPSWPTEWQMHTVFMAYSDYMHTGNTETIARFYDDLRAKTLIDLERDDGLISTTTGLVNDEFLHKIHYRGKSFRDIVDWPAGTPVGKKQANNQGPTPEGERDGYIFMPINTVVNAFHYRALVLMAEMARAVGKQDDALLLKNRAEKVRASFNRLLFDGKRGIYVDGVGTAHATLHANMFPLAFGLVPEKWIPGVVKYIKSKDMACSFYGAQYLLQALYNAGEAEYALGLMTSDSKRSWLNMIRVGSTMTTEAWDEYYKPNLTWNHAWGSAPANIIPRELMGITPLQPAFRKVRIKPQPGNLESASIKMPTIRGFIYCTWKKSDSGFHLDVTIPANTSAEVWLPTKSVDGVKENGQDICSVKDILLKGEKDNYVICETSAGRYHFSWGESGK